jgi:hypothetical protein
MLVVGVGAIAAVRDWANPPNYDLAASRTCFEKHATVKAIPKGAGLWNFPGLRVRFPGETRQSETRLYFASSTDEAKSAEVPDSERMQRRRNVLSEWSAYSAWDPRVTRCLRERRSEQARR